MNRLRHLLLHLGIAAKKVAAESHEWRVFRRAVLIEDNLSREEIRRKIEHLESVYRKIRHRYDDEERMLCIEERIVALKRMLWNSHVRASRF